MPVQSIECQLVRAQIGRYLGGEPLSAEAMRQLEIHLVGCDECRAAIAVRKSDLRAKMATEAKEGRYPNRPEAPTAAKAAIDYKAVQASIDSVPEKPQKAANWKAPSFTKPMVLTLVLGGVLILMSRMSGGNGLGFGATALSMFSPSNSAAAPAPKTAAVPAAAPTPAPTTSSTTPPAGNSAPVTQPAANPVVQPTVVSPPASHSAAPQTTPVPPPATTTPKPTPPASTPVVKSTPPAVSHESASKPAEPVHHEEAPVQPAVVHRAHRHTHHVRRRPQPVRHRRTVRHSTTRVRVYDASGDPIQN